MDMNHLIELLSDGYAHSTAKLAEELNTTPGDVERTLEYMENMGILKKTDLGSVACGSCSSKCGDGACNGCTGGSGGGNTCKGCMPENGFQNMGVIWEVV